MIKKFKSLVRKIGITGKSPVNTRQELIDFVISYVAYVSQVTLYKYVDVRASTQYPKLFENTHFLTSLKMVRRHIYGAAVCDLALFAAT